MVNNNNTIPIEVNKKPFETVYELKNDYEVPTFEEFMKGYESNGNLNYDDLSGGSIIGEVKGYGPCSSCSGSNKNLKFKLAITLENCIGDAKGCTVHNTNDALEEARKILGGRGHWTNFFLSYFSSEDRENLFDKIYDKISYHEEGNDVDTSVCNKNDCSSGEGFYEFYDDYKGGYRGR